LGLAYVAASARDAGHEVQVVDGVGEAPARLFERGGSHWLGLDNPEIVERIAADTDVIGVSNMFSHNWPMVRELLQRIREALPRTPLLLGGESPTSLPELVLTQSPADLCVLGEGEETLCAVIAALGGGAPLDGVEGIAYKRRGGEVAFTPRRQRIREVDDIPRPAWDLFDIEAYIERNLTNGLQVAGARPALPILATRGCPYQCTFCTSPQMWTTRYITRDPAGVVDEIATYVKRYGATNFPFQDLTAIIRKDWIAAFCRELIDRGLDIHWQLPSGTRSEAVDEEVAPLLERSGMAHVAYAPESGSARVRKEIKKRVKAETFYASARASVDAGLHVQAFFVMGFPEEETRDLRASLGMIARLAWMGIEDVCVSHYMPYPGSEMYEALVERGKVDYSDRWLTAPLHTHGMRIPETSQVNENFGALTQSAYVLLGYALFYAISAVRKPRYFLNMLWGLLFRPSDDVSRLQRALKGILGTKPIFETPPPGTDESAGRPYRPSGERRDPSPRPTVDAKYPRAQK
jgi:radical SAM superfamily enzyme YgiQ (UPF0313 family)